MQIDGLTKVIAKLKLASLQYGTTKVSVVVGYTAAHALPVHENRAMVLKGQPRRAPSKGLYWDPLGKARPGFLLDVSREQHREIARVVEQALKQGLPLDKALLLGGLLLQRESQEAVPVDTGTLKASAFTRIESTS
jgi:hypothetical protein